MPFILKRYAMPAFINIAKDDSEPCLINAQGIAAISFFDKSDFNDTAHIHVAYANGAMDRFFNYTNSAQVFELEDIAQKLDEAGHAVMRDTRNNLIFPDSVIYIKYCPTDAPGGGALLALGLSGVDQEVAVTGTQAQLDSAVARITGTRFFTAFDVEKTDYTNAANPTKIYICPSEISLIRDQAYTVEVRFGEFNHPMHINVNIKAGIQDVPATASQAFKDALNAQKDIEMRSLKPLARALARQCPQLLAINTNGTADNSLLYIAPEKIARIMPFPHYKFLNVTLKSRNPHGSQTIQVDCGSEDAMNAAFQALTQPPKKPAGKFNPKP